MADFKAGKAPLSPEELSQFNAETFELIRDVAKAICHRRECDLIEDRLDWDADSEPLDSYRAAQRHENRRLQIGLKPGSASSIYTVAAMYLMQITSGDD